MTLAIGIGATTTLYTLLRVALSSSTPDIEDVARVGRIYAASPSLGVERAPMTLNDYERVVSQAPAFETIGAYAGVEMTLGSGPDAETIPVTLVSADFFTVLRAHATAGRLFDHADFERGAPVLLIGEKIWRRRFAGQPVESGIVVSLNGVERRVLGIVSAAVESPFIGIAGDAWLPLAGSDRDPQRTVSVIGRLKPENSWATAVAELSALAPPSERDSTWRWRAIPVEQDTRTRAVGATAGTLLPALVVLVIACLNVSCMLLARGVERDTELSIRRALGATRAAIFRQLLMENLLLALAGGTAGAALAVWAKRAIGAVLAVSKPFLAERLADDFRLLPAALVSSVVACALFGTVPAVRLSRRDIASSLKGVAPHGRTRVAGYGPRDLVVFVELGLAVMLVVVAAMWLSFFTILTHVTASFPASEVVIDHVAQRDLAVVTDRVRAVPGVARTTVASDLPGRNRTPTMLRADNGRAARGAVVDVGESFFETLGLPIVRGRAFDRTETGKDAAVAVVSESVARALWPDELAVGKDLDLSLRGNPTRVRVIGVSRNAIEFGGLGVLTAGDVYRPIGTATLQEAILFARVQHAAGALRSIAAATRPSPAAPASKPAVLADIIAYAPPDSMSVVHMLVAFGLVALLLAATGIFAVISQSVAQRTTEFGVRMALGASAGQVVRMVLSRESKLIAAAIASGAVGTIAVTRTLFAELVTLSALHPFWPAVLMMICGGVALSASVLAIRRIVRLDPCVTLRRS